MRRRQHLGNGRFQPGKFEDVMTLARDVPERALFSAWLLLHLEIELIAVIGICDAGDDLHIFSAGMKHLQPQQVTGSII
jgi:hypothetical protein